MDRRGNTVIPARFDHVEDFFEQKAVASVGGKTGYIDETGRWTIEPTFNRADRFNGGLWNSTVPTGFQRISPPSKKESCGAISTNPEDGSYRRASTQHIPSSMDWPW
jgi:hypothetical protein